MVKFNKELETRQRFLEESHVEAQEIINVIMSNTGDATTLGIIQQKIYDIKAIAYREGLKF